MTSLGPDDLERGMRSLPAPPRDLGRVCKLVQRLPGEARACPASARVEPGAGLVGDRWSVSAAPNPEAEVTLMRVDVAELLCGGRGVELLGDNLFVTLDTSAANLPPGTRLRVGEARCEVTAKPHTGCGKFSRRVGEAALLLTRSPGWKEQNLRGVHLRVVSGGSVSVGDEIRVEARP